MAKVSGTLYTYSDNSPGFKALIAAKYSGAKITTKLCKTNNSSDFLAKFPLGCVPAFECSTGLCLSQSSAIAYYLADEELRGGGEGNSAKVQQFMFWAECDLEPLLSSVSRNKKMIMKYLKYLDDILLHSTFLVGEKISLADIAVACTLIKAYKNMLDRSSRNVLQNITRWFLTCVNQPNFKAVVGEIELCEEDHSGLAAFVKDSESVKVAEPAVEEAKPVKKADDPMESLPKGTWIIDDFKRFYSNNDEDKAISYFWEKFDAENYSIWSCDYMYSDTLSLIFMSCNLIGGMFQRLDKLRKYAFGSMMLFGDDSESSISGLWIWRGHDLAFELCEDWKVDYSSFEWKKLDPSKEETKKQVEKYFKWTGDDAKGRKFNQGKIFK